MKPLILLLTLLSACATPPEGPVPDIPLCRDGVPLVARVDGRIVPGNHSCRT